MVSLEYGILYSIENNESFIEFELYLLLIYVNYLIFEIYNILYSAYLQHHFFIVDSSASLSKEYVL